MNKDVVYIDVEDDITAIIGKIKASKEKIVALVPPARIGALQSAVNLRLLHRTATLANKRLVLITNNKALSALASAASIPVAKNLQSKPELAEIPVLEVDDDDVIDGGQIPVGELADSAPSDETAKDAAEAALVSGVNINDSSAAKKPLKKLLPARASKKPGDKKVPNFNKLRKRIFIAVGAGILLVALLVWAFVFAPSAKVIITARTSAVQVKGVVQLGATTEADKSTIKAITQTDKKDAVIEFAATGEKDVGAKATGTVRFSTGSIANLGQTIPAGTVLQSTSGASYTTTSAATFTLSNYGGINVGIAAAASGESYNGASGAMSGAPSGVSANIVGSTSGGTTKVVPIVTAGDVQAAKEKLVAQSEDAVRTALAGKFAKDDIVLDGSFVVSRSDVVASPDVGAEAPDKKATLKSSVTYSMSGVAKAELETYLEQALKAQMEDQTKQKVYASGVKTAKFTDVKASESAVSASLDATGQVGPVIKEDSVKEQVAGKKFGDIRNQLMTINGVSDVEVKFPYFWVRTVPKDVKKISIEFKVEGSSD